MAVVVAWCLQVVAAGVAHAAMDGVPPVVVVVRDRAVPTAILGLERIMTPAHTSVLIGDYDPLTRVTHRPHLRSVDALHVPLDGVGAVRRDCLRHRVADA